MTKKKLNPNEGMTPDDGDVRFLDVALELPEREIDAIEDGGNTSPGTVVQVAPVAQDGRPKSLSDIMDNGGDLSDLQSFAKMMFPALGNGISGNSLMVARIPPDVFLPQLHLSSINDIMATPFVKSSETYEVIENGRKVTKTVGTFIPSHVDIGEKWQTNLALLTIGLDGRGRIDLGLLAGASREEKRLTDVGRLGS